jgi:hypothetical protein
MARKQGVSQKYAQIVGRILVIVFSCIFFYAVSGRTVISADEPGQWDAPAHFTFQGNTYFYRGSTAYELPDGYHYAGESGGLLFSDSNVDGGALINEENPGAAYFQWDTWDEAADGPKPYLCFISESCSLRQKIRVNKNKNRDNLNP